MTYSRNYLYSNLLQSPFRFGRSSTRLQVMADLARAIGLWGLLKFSVHFHEKKKNTVLFLFFYQVMPYHHNTKRKYNFQTNECQT